MHHLHLYVVHSLLTHRALVTDVAVKPLRIRTCHGSVTNISHAKEMQEPKFSIATEEKVCDHCYNTHYHRIYS